MILILSIVVFLGYLAIERIILERRLKAVPLRICITGTRGKTSVVRMLAAILREDGKRVLAKTTGSTPCFILPDGAESEIRRRGLTSIIEQKALVKKAAKLKVDCLAAEIMSILPENHFIEAQRILKPHIVIITNVRCDHTAAMGQTLDEIARVFTLDIPPKAMVFILEKENRPLFAAAVKQVAGTLICVDEKLPPRLKPALEKSFFPDNILLVYALCRHLNIRQTSIIKGLQNVKHDIGEFKVWRCKPGQANREYFFVNGFAANDPESTFEIMAKINKVFPFAAGKLVGVLSLRADRADRTLQWIEALKGGGIEHFKWLFVIGGHAGAVARRLKSDRVIILRGKKANEVMAEIMRVTAFPVAFVHERVQGDDERSVGDGYVIFGFGNIRGIGAQLIDHWRGIGEEYGY